MTGRRVVLILLCLIAFFVPWEEMLTTPEFGTAIFLVSSVALAFAVLLVAWRFRIRRIHPVLVLLSFFVFWSVMSAMWSVDPQATQRKSLTYLSLLVLVWMIWEFVDSEMKFLWLLRSYILGCCVTLGLLFVDYVSSRHAFAATDTRYTGGGLNQNAFALLLTIGIVIAAYLAIHPNSRFRVFYWVFIVPASLGVLLTGSRTGAIALVVALFVATALSLSRSLKAMLVLIAIVAGTVWLVPSVIPADLLSRVTEGTSAQTFVEREDQWKLGLELWHGTPFLGVGTGAFITAALSDGGRGLMAHNAFVQLLAEDGLIGFGIMLLVWYLLARKAWKLPRHERLLWLGAGAAWLLGASMLSSEYYKITWLLYAWIMTQPAPVPQAPEESVSATASRDAYTNLAGTQRATIGERQETGA